MPHCLQAKILDAQMIEIIHFPSIFPNKSAKCPTFGRCFGMFWDADPWPPHHRHAKDRPHGSALWRRRPAHLGRVVAGGALVKREIFRWTMGGKKKQVGNLKDTIILCVIIIIIYIYKSKI